MHLLFIKKYESTLLSSANLLGKNSKNDLEIQVVHVHTMMHNAKGDVAVMNISRETNDFHNLVQYPK